MFYSILHYSRLKIIVLLFTMLCPFLSYSQSVVVPESVKKKCSNSPVEKRVRLAVARFSKTTDVYSGRNIDNFASMLSNAMFEIECFRMLSTINDANYKYTEKESSDVRPHFIVTGEIIEYDHTVQEVKLPVGKALVTKYNAQIGFVLQIKDPVTKEIVFSKSFNQSASSTNTKVGNSTSNQTIDKAYHDALEKGILDAVTYIVDNRDRIYQHVNLISADEGVTAESSTVTSKFQIYSSNITFSKLVELERVLTAHKSVKRIEKKLTQNKGEMNVTMIGSIDELVSVLSNSFSDRLTIEGFEPKKLTITLK